MILPGRLASVARTGGGRNVRLFACRTGFQPARADTMKLRTRRCHRSVNVVQLDRRCGSVARSDRTRSGPSVLQQWRRLHWQEASAAARRARRAATRRATPLARPSAGPVDSRPTLARWPLSALLRPTARAVTREPAIRRQAVSADRERRVPLPRAPLDTHDEVRDRRSAVPTCARRGSETGTRARRCASTGAMSRDSARRLLRGARRPPKSSRAQTDRDPRSRAGSSSCRIQMVRAEQ